MSDKVFVDSNVLVYGHDRGAGEKHRMAVDLLKRLWADRSGILSTQVLQETWVNIRKKAQQPISREEALGLIEDYSRWEIVVNTAESVIEAIRLEQRFGISFWDALIVHAAQSAGVKKLYTEDLNAGQSYGTVEVIDPFA